MPTRVMSFEYDSRTAFIKSVTDIDDEVNILLNRVIEERDSVAEKSRPLIFIAYSLGGIVVKKVRYKSVELQCSDYSLSDDRQSFGRMSAHKYMVTSSDA